MKKNILLLGLFSCLAFFTKGQDSLVNLTLKQVLQMGMDSSKSLKISSAKMQLAEAKYQQAIDAVLPTVRFTAGYTRLSDIDEPKLLFPGATKPVSLFPVYVNNYATAVSVSETIFSGFRLKYAKESQKFLRDAARFENEKDKTETAFTIIQAYFSLFKLKASEKTVEENMKQVNERLRETQLAQQNGIATKNDVLRWELQVSNLELAQIDIRNNIAIANYNLCLMLGLSENAHINPDSNDMNALTGNKSFNDYLSLALDKRSDLTAAGLHTKALKNILNVAQNSYLPRISVNGEFLNSRPNARYIPPVDEFHSTWSAGIALSWDLVSLYSNKHFVDEAQSNYRQSLESSTILTDAIKSEINQNYLLLQEAIQKETVMKKTVEQAAENYRLMNSRYKNSLVVLSDLLEANTQLLNSQISYSFAKADVQIAYYRLLKSTGSIN